MMENNVNTVVEDMIKVNPETLAQANSELLEKAISETVATLPAAAQTKPVTRTWTTKNILIGGAALLTGAGIGVAVDKWVAPWISKKIDQAAKNREAKKAAKAAKKAAKKAAQEPKPANPAPDTSAQNNPIPADGKVD